MLDIVLSGVTITYMYLLSRRIKAGLYFVQLLWLVFIMQNAAWGLIPLNIALWYVCITGITKWEENET